MSELRWKKSTDSADGDQCLEAAEDGEFVWVRNSKDPDGPRVRYTRSEWRAFLAGAKRGEFDF